MNIFILDQTPELSAESHCDKHVVKMILESAQIASTALHLNGVTDPVMYKIAHKGHPCCIWAAENARHLRYVIELGLSLCMEYRLRYNKVHASERVLISLSKYTRPSPRPKYYAVCMAEPYRTEGWAPHLPLDETIRFYRQYYHLAKAGFAKWPTPPTWWKTESL